LFLVATGACGSSGSAKAGSDASSTTTGSTSTSPATATTPTSGTTTSGAPTQSAFTGVVVKTTALALPLTYHAGCPVPPSQLRTLYMSYWGFDGQSHLGSMVVNEKVTQPVLAVFERLYAHRFPIAQMVPVDTYGGDDRASMAGDNTSGFNCRNAVAPGPPQWSAHAYGTAIDVNPVENPYVEGGVVQPAAGSAFLDRSHHRAGMAYPGGELVTAFASVGWQWGGRWSAPDYQHFSANGK
jgi:D-alanyl-D-alanine carboxypeptidase